MRKKQPPRHTFSSPKTSNPELPAVLFDLDGTLIDSNYQHVNAWAEVLLAAGIVIPRWKIHRRVGMSGKSMIHELLRETPDKPRRINIDQLEHKHGARFRRYRPASGARSRRNRGARRRIGARAGRAARGRRRG